MHGEPLKKKPKPIIPSICLQNDDGISLDTIAPTSTSTSFRSDLFDSNHKKTHEKPVGEFLWQNVCRHISIKDYLRE